MIINESHKLKKVKHRKEELIEISQIKMSATTNVCSAKFWIKSCDCHIRLHYRL